MEHVKEIFDSIARVFSYPGEEYMRNVARCRELCTASRFENDEVGRTVLARLDSFNVAIDGLSIGELEELYTRTFDINPVGSLEVGWHLHGETYERGAFLVQMRDLLRRCSIEESSELPDHLTHTLLAVGRMGKEEGSAFISSRLLKAIDKMLEGFVGKGNPYEHMLTATKLLLTETCMQTPQQEVKS